MCHRITGRKSLRWGGAQRPPVDRLYSLICPDLRQQIQRNFTKRTAQITPVAAPRVAQTGVLSVPLVPMAHSQTCLRCVSLYSYQAYAYPVHVPRDIWPLLAIVLSDFSIHWEGPMLQCRYSRVRRFTFPFLSSLSRRILAPLAPDTQRRLVENNAVPCSAQRRSRSIACIRMWWQWHIPNGHHKESLYAT